MKDTVTENKRRISNITTIISLLLAIVGIGIIVYDYLLEQRAVNINATITALDYKDGEYKATVKYKVDKESYNQVVPIKDNNYTVNDELPVKYDINNPGQLINNNHFINFLFINLFVTLFSTKPSYFQ